MQNIILQYLIWHFIDTPKKLLLVWKNFLLFNLSYFSISLLLKTLFSPWRRYQWSRGKGFDLKVYFEVLFSNLISRVLGAIVRSFFIIIGLIIEVLIICLGFIIFVGWLFLPVILIWGFVFGFIRIII